ncbi:MAG TPA: RNA polymerase sigma factor [Chthonomonadaceae bacterium]|nr:RNA polymerase sigma factor [Chthonomonadaceae bacterium]
MEPEPDEYALACRAQQGDPAALAELVERTRLRLFALAYAELRHYEDAQDAVAAALVHVCLHIAELREPERVRGWMQTIVRNETRRMRRGRSAQPAIPLDTLADTATGSEPCSLLRLDIERALKQIPRDEAHSLALFYLQGLPIEVIARRTGRPEGTIKRWLHGGRQRLATQMKEYRPMEPIPAPTAVILSTELEPSYTQSLADALRAAGFGDVAILPGLPPLEWTGAGGALDYHLPSPLKEARLLVLDEWIGGRSAFELYVLIRATVEGRQAGVCQLLRSPAQATVFAAWAAGCDMCFTQETLDAETFERLTRQWLKQTEATSEGSGESQATPS